MSVNDENWLDYLTDEEQRQVDEIEVRILYHKEKIADLRKKHRRWLHTGTSRKRRASGAGREQK